MLDTADAERARRADAAAVTAPPRAPAARRRRPRPYALAGAVLAAGLLVSALLALVSASTYRTNERRLLELRAHDVGSVLTEALPNLQTPLAAAAALAAATGGDAVRFRRFVSPYVGSGAGKQFVSVSLWRVGPGGPGTVPQALATVGAAPQITGTGEDRVRRFLRGAAAANGLSVTGLLGGRAPRLGYGYSGTGQITFVIYGESALPPSRRAPPQRNSAFSDLDYALYLGRRPVDSGLIVASVRRLPLTGRVSTVTIPFGDSALTLTVSARSALSGSLPRALPWLIAVVGTLLSLGATWITARLIGRRRQAEHLAGRLEASAEENLRLYAEQRSIATTLQHALLPDALPDLPGLVTSARYEPGVAGVDVGGDWYDLLRLDDGRALLVVGDVSGRGLRAATAMAALRYAIHAYAAEGRPPAEAVAGLSRLVTVRTTGQIATVLCALIDIAAHRVTVTSAGHLPPLLLTDGRAEFVRSAVGLPVGVAETGDYVSRTVSVPPGATLLAFTDGLVERRDETIDAGLERLRHTVETAPPNLDALLAHVVDDLREDAPDDTAIVGIRWLN